MRRIIKLRGEQAKEFREMCQRRLLNYLQRYFDITYRYFQWRTREIRQHGVDINYSQQVTVEGPRKLKMIIEAEITEETVEAFVRHVARLKGFELEEHKTLQRDLKVGEFWVESGVGYGEVTSSPFEEAEEEEEEREEEKA